MPVKVSRGRSTTQRGTSRLHCIMRVELCFAPAELMAVGTVCKNEYLDTVHSIYFSTSIVNIMIPVLDVRLLTRA